MPETSATDAAIAAAAADLAGWSADVRRHLGSTPERAFCEKQTAAAVATVAAELGLTVRQGIGRTGVVAELDTGRPGRHVAMRADMDALPLDGGELRHSCGHDGNMAAALTAVRILTQTGAMTAGRLRVIFQPAEEVGGGAKAMIADGVLGDPPVEAMVAAHAWPGTPIRSVACRPGPMLAACDDFTVNIIGHGGHGVRPSAARNPIDGIAAAAADLNALTTETRVVSVCIVRSGSSPNVIPATGQMQGTLRTLDEPTRLETQDAMRAMIHKACRQRQLTGTVVFETHCPVVRIPEALYALFRRAAAAVVGEQNVVLLTESSMGSEDYGWYLRQVPGLMFRVGMGDDGPPLHHPDFCYRDEGLAPAAGVLAAMTARLVREIPSA